MKKFGLIGGALIVGVVGAFASVANAQQAAPVAPQAAPNAPLERFPISRLHNRS